MHNNIGLTAHQGLDQEQPILSSKSFTIDAPAFLEPTYHYSLERTILEKVSIFLDPQVAISANTRWIRGKIQDP
jgi:hypothetical protein